MTITMHRQTPQAGRRGFSRRRFLLSTAMVGVTTGSMLRVAGAAGAAVLDAGQSATLLRMVQDIYPHPDLLELSHYEAIVEIVAAKAADDAANAAALTDGLARIEEQARALHGTGYTRIADPDAREGLLRRFQDEGFFQGVRWTAYFAIYNNTALWPRFGYGGSSVEHGGYIDRGFSDITFVPPGPTLAQRLAEVGG